MKLFLRSFSSLRLNYSRRVVVSYKRKYVHKVLVNCFACSMVHGMTIAVDLGRKATTKNVPGSFSERTLYTVLLILPNIESLWLGICI